MIKNKQLILGIIIGVLLTSTIVYAAYKYQASEVGYTPSNADFDVDNVSDAIKELYEKCGNNSSETPTNILGNIEKSENFLPNGYYKSTAEDNNVIFGGYCWKIVRKTDDEDIRMLYNGTPTNGECTKTGEDTQIGTSKYSDDSIVTNYADSKVKDVVDNWYNINLAASYSEKINTIDLITREEASTVGGGYLVSGQQYWTQTSSGENASTTSSCSISYSAGSNKGSCSSTPSGEIYSSGIYIVNASGEIVNSNNGSYSGSVLGSCSYCIKWAYLYSDGKCASCSSSGTGTGRPMSSSNNSCSCCSNSTYEGSCTTSVSGSSLGIRPVITLNNIVELQGGNGTTSSPYYLK